MKLADFIYELPAELIARYPLKERSASRLLCLNSETGEIRHQTFSDIISLLQPGDLLICNNSRVIPARLFGEKETGGKVEVLVERILDQNRALAHVRASKSPKPGSILHFAQETKLKVVDRQNNLFELELIQSPPCEKGRAAPYFPPFEKGGRGGILHFLETHGEIPLPPYFHRSPEELDKDRYQTIYAKHKGSVAAPTAGLHFTPEIMSQLLVKGIEIDYVTLHIGAGTFAPVKVDDITQHHMHSEYIEVSSELCEKINKIKAQGRRVIAVGTTSARSLETASRTGSVAPYSGETNIFIYPGFQFKCVDALITNLHLPGSTLLMLVSAFGGYERIMNAYREAISQQYRFFSYGDAMFIT